MILTVLQREDCLIWRCLCKVCVCTIFVYSSAVIDDKSHTRGNNCLQSLKLVISENYSNIEN